MTATTHSLNGSARDEEPLVDAWVNGRRGLVVARGNVELADLNTVGRVRNSGVGAGALVSVS